MAGRGAAAETGKSVFCLTVLFLGVSLFHARGLLPGNSFLAVDLASNNLPWLSGPPQRLQNWLISDPIYQTYPFLSYAIETVRRGDWPLWNPNILLGHPSFADPLAQSFYPVFLGLGLLFGAARGLTLGLWLHAVLAAGLTFGLLRSIGCTRSVAVLGGFTYALGGYMVNWFETPFWLSTLSWLPGVLWSFEAAAQRRSLRAAALGAAAFALAILGGQLSFGLLFALFLLLYAVGRAVEYHLRRDDREGWALLSAPLVLVPALLLSAVQTVPFLELLGLSHRAAITWTPDPIPVRQLITLIVPNFYGNPSTSGSYWGALNFSEAVIYCGVPALLLAFLAPLWSKRFFAAYLAVVTVATIYLAVAGPGVDAVASMPPMRFASLHRALFLLPLEGALLSGMALSEPKVRTVLVLPAASILVAAAGAAVYWNWGDAQSHLVELQLPLVQASGFLAATVALLSIRSGFPKLRLHADVTMVALAFGDLFLFGSGFNPVGPIDRLMPPTPAVRYLQTHLGQHRMVSFQRGDQLLFGPNVVSLYGLAEGGGYSSLILEPLRRLVAEADPKEGAAGISFWLKQNANIVFFYNPSQRLLDLLQVSHVVSPVSLDGMPGVYTGEVKIYRRRAYPPRAYLVYGVEVIPGETEARKRLLEDSFDPEKVALVESPLGLPATSSVPPGSAEIVEYRSTMVRLRTATDRPGLLVLGDQYYPGWQAFVDGRPAPIERVNLIWRGVMLPPGGHEVVFRFEPVSLRIGALLGIVGAALLVAIVVIDLKRAGPRPAPPLDMVTWSER